jgi:hypothetical protein
MVRDMRRFAAVSLVILALIGGLGASATASSEVCGRPNAPPCALQAWMRARMAQPYAERRFDEVAANAAALATFNPDPRGWRDWDELARDAARAALAHDEAKTLHACTQCHHSHRREYVERYRGRELPARR